MNAVTETSTRIAAVPWLMSYWVSTHPARAPVRPKTPALKIVRMNALCRKIATIVGAVTETKVAGAQPNRSRAATAKTKPSETPFASAPSTGTGNRSASVEASRNAPTPTTVVVEPGSPAKENVAATYAATPTRETGATTARSLAGGSTRPLINERVLPGEVGSRPGEVGKLAREDHKGRQNHDRRHLRVPLNHQNPPSRVPQQGNHGSRDCAWASPEGVKAPRSSRIPRKGDSRSDGTL